MERRLLGGGGVGTVKRVDRKVLSRFYFLDETRVRRRGVCILVTDRSMIATHAMWIPCTFLYCTPWPCSWSLVSLEKIDCRPGTWPRGAILKYTRNSHCVHTVTKIHLDSERVFIFVDSMMLTESRLERDKAHSFGYCYLHPLPCNCRFRAPNSNKQVVLPHLVL